ncbi:MAG: cell division ATP-binding protein FtsE [Clostridiaceae bacterium]|nr:cell division ATP-binding protein FtsE [Clostridiaceae bacterium]
MAYIEFENVSKTYPNGTLALHDLSFSINEGEFVFLIGESGAGKSTVFRLLTREEDPSSGRIMVDGYDIGKLSERRVPYLRRGIGLIFQDFRLIDTLTVGENVSLAMEIIGESPRKIRQRVPLVLSVVGLRRKIDNYPTELSGGEQQRVCIARALINKPRLIIADEPTGDLDPVNGETVMALLDRINRENGTTIITCTHDREIVDRMNRRVIEVCDGVLARDDSRGHYVLESERKNGLGYAEYCAKQQELAAEEIRREIEEGGEALRRLREENGSAPDARVTRERVRKMRESVRGDDFYDRMDKSASMRRNRPPARQRSRELREQFIESQKDPDSPATPPLALPQTPVIDADNERLSRTGRIPVIKLKGEDKGEGKKRSDDA